MAQENAFLLQRALIHGLQCNQFVIDEEKDIIVFSCVCFGQLNWLWGLGVSVSDIRVCLLLFLRIKNLAESVFDCCTCRSEMVVVVLADLLINQRTGQLYS